MLKKSLYLLLTLCLVFSGYQLEGFFGSTDLRLWQVFVVTIFIILILKNKFYFPRILLLNFTIIISLFTLLSSFVTSIDFFILLKSILPMMLLLLISYSIIRIIGVAIVNKAYYRAAIIISASIYLQQLIHIVNPSFANQFFVVSEKTYIFVRASGFLGEPSWGGIFLAPVLFVSLIKQDYKGYFFVVLACVFTFSLLTYISVAFSHILFYLFYNKLNFKKIFLILVSFFMILTSFNLELIKEKSDQVVSSVTVFISDGSYDMNDFTSMAGTAATLTMNTLVAVKAAKETYGFGNGFGNFKGAFSKYSPFYLPPEYNGEGLFYNRVGGSSLWIRSLAETGVFGFLVLLFLHVYSIRCFLRLSKKTMIDKVNIIRNENLLSLMGLAIIIMSVYSLRKDSWVNLLFCMSIVIVVSTSTEKLRDKLPS